LAFDLRFEVFYKLLGNHRKEVGHERLPGGGDSLAKSWRMNRKRK
jgi:hypothetical protein